MLAESFRAHHPDARFAAVVLDDPDGDIGPGEPFEALRPADLGLDPGEVHRRATMYAPQAFVSSLKPNVLLSLVRGGDAPAIFLEADSCVYASLDHVADRARRHSIVLTPAARDPYPAIDDFAPERTLVATPMNGGLVGASADAGAFLEWWAERTARHCIFLRQAGLAYSEGWLALVPAFFDHHVLREDHGCNVMVWNLHVRDIEWDGDVPTVAGGPLRHFHFAGPFDPERPDLLAGYHEAHRGWWPRPEERPGLARLCREYADRLLARGHREDRAREALYASMPDGRPIEPWMRELFRSGLVASERGEAPEPPNPFAHGPGRFLDWLQSRERAHAADPAPVAPDAALADHTQAVAHLKRLEDEVESQRGQVEAWRRAHAAELAARVAADARASEMHAEAVRMGQSMSWRITRPLRAASAALRR